jgi:hypothetical protein
MEPGVHTHQSVQRIFFVLDIFPIRVLKYIQQEPARYKKQHPRMKFAFLPSRVHFSLHSRKSISCANSSALCAFWQQGTEHELMPNIHYRHKEQ